MMEEKKEKTPKEFYSVGEVATQTEKVIRDNETEENLDIFGILVKIANDVAELKKHLV
jgi:hypothetical protein